MASTCDIGVYNIASGVNFCGENFSGNFVFGGSWKKTQKSHKLEPKNFAPHGMSILLVL